MTIESVRVGKFAVPMVRATEWVARYTDPANRTAKSPYAYPAYDTYNAGQNDPAMLTDADFLAPGLLNVPVKIRSFYDLQTIRGVLESGLSRVELSTPLPELAADQIRTHIGGLYSVLDDKNTKPWRVRGTTLSKVLHRKRPQSIPLYDKWVRACYVGEDAPVPFAEERTWAEYMSELSVAMASDLRTGAAAFAELQAASGAEPGLSDLRLLDILAWHRGQE